MIEKAKKCGECIHAEHCEQNPRLSKFSRDNPAWCELFNSRADLVEREADENDEYLRGEWEMFERVSNAYWSKQMYFLNEDGTVYSRVSCKSMTKDEAFCEFLERIAED